MTKVLINGADGKMGAMIANIISGNPDLGMETLKRENGQKVSGGFDIIIDFSSPEGARESFALAKSAKTPYLTGTTNLSKDFIEEMRGEKSIAVFFSPNVSIGVYLFKELLKKSVSYFPDYIKKMHEVHHAQKKDAPSGTAKLLAAAIDFPINDITYERVGGFPGTHSLTLLSPDSAEKITLVHEALDRRLFAESAVKVAVWLLRRKAGFYDMSDYADDLR
jgi:4-hydroxy-tetrahydrodipicolinate reductase